MPPPDGIDFDIAAPHATSLVESLRAFGYELDTALADLVDNSITAGAQNIWIDFNWNGSESVIAVTDDGSGMTERELVAAMRPGSMNPLAERKPKDLGRFGLGLKTASFSQCRRLTVRSTSLQGDFATRCWDLDHIASVNDWQLLRTSDPEANSLARRLTGLNHGTVVVWQKLDRLTAGQRTESERDHQLFLQRAERVKLHLAMVFHRFISGSQALRIMLNDRPIEPWDPYLANEPATQTLPLTRLKYDGATIEVQPYILPHHSKISKSRHAAAGGPRGWNAQQGFYVYRNTRLLVPGDWLGFGWSKEEHYKLARIRVDVPNALDHAWAIDVTKSRATPPAELRDDLRSIAERTRNEAKRVYSHRGARLTSSADSERLLLWKPMSRHDKMFYQLNREHPLLKQAMASCTNLPALNALFRLIEETVPLPHITIQNSEYPNSLPSPFEHAAERQIREVLEQAFASLIKVGYNRQDAVNRLTTIWPFELFPALLQSVAESHHHA